MATGVPTVPGFSFSTGPNIVTPSTNTSFAPVFGGSGDFFGRTGSGSGVGFQLDGLTLVLLAAGGLAAFLIASGKVKL